MSLLWLPTATRDERGGFPWQVTCPTKGVLHTTESGSWPNYPPRYHPHATVLPHPGKGVDVRQHAPFDRATYALVHAAGTVATNGAHALQFELVGTCDPDGPKGAYYWPDADDTVLADLYRKVVKPVADAYGIRLVAPTFKAYPASYGLARRVGEDAPAVDEPSIFAAPVDPGERTDDDPGAPEVPDLPAGSMAARLGATNGVRLSEAAWLAWDGWLGHEHVPGGNLHGDPGAFPFGRMLKAAGTTPPVHKPTVIHGPLKYGDHGTSVRYVQARLRIHVDGDFGPQTRATVHAYQRHEHLTADSIVGPATAASMGFAYAAK